jgi:hydrogenase expression/formation protein HypC
MCLGIPAKIIFIEGEMATVSIGGVEYPASLQLLPDASLGDYVIIHAGFAIEKIDLQEAEETIRIIQEIEKGFRNNTG